MNATYVGIYFISLVYFTNVLLTKALGNAALYLILKHY